MAKQAGTIDEYIAAFPPATRAVLEELRVLITSSVPGLTEKISYGMPTFDLNGSYFVYFAGWKKHIGFYPVTAAVGAELGAEIQRYRSGQGSLQFPLDEPLPTDLIRRILAIRMMERS